MSREKKEIIFKREQETVVSSLLDVIYNGNFAHGVRQKQELRIALDRSIVKEIEMVFLSREGGRLCFIVTSEAEENMSY